jgi:hypothetical protein
MREQGRQLWNKRKETGKTENDVFENRLLRSVDIKGRTWREAGEDCIMKSVITRTLRKVLLG